MLATGAGGMIHPAPQAPTVSFGRGLFRLASMIVTDASRDCFGWLKDRVIDYPGTVQSIVDFSMVRTFLNVVVSQFKEKPMFDSQTLRTAFGKLSMTESRERKNHTHGKLAGMRASVGDTIDRLAAQLGLQILSMDGSPRDIAAGRLFRKVWRKAKDLLVPLSRMKRVKTPLIVYVDADHSVDMPSALSKHFHPTVIYTVQPDNVAKDAEGYGYSYTFNESNHLEFFVSGGAKYVYPVWNYGHDHIQCYQRMFGIPFTHSIYSVDRKGVFQDHELILLSPIARTRGLFAIYSWLMLEGDVLSRLRPVQGLFSRMTVRAKEAMYICTGRPGEFSSSKLKAIDDETIATTARISAYDLAVNQAQVYTNGNRQQAVLLTEYHRNKVPRKIPIVWPVEDAVQTYEFYPLDSDPHPKSCMKAFMSPLYDACYSPARTLNNERRMIETRVETPSPQHLHVTPFMTKMMAEFAVLLVPEAHKVDPETYETVLDRMSRPAQRRILETSNYETTPPVASAFMKGENYVSFGDPRPITTITGHIKRSYSMYTYAMDHIMKRAQWYAFGKTPLDVAERVALICTNATSVVNTDYSRFDGHVSNVLREFERVIFLRVFRKEHHVEVINLHSKQYNLKGYAPFGEKYSTRMSRLSGSPETSLFNSLANAFIAYCTLRKTSAPPEWCWERLGIYGGDDGLTADIDPRIYVKTAEMFGQALTIEPLKRGEPGVCFLSRKYSPDVWHGSKDSCCDLIRQISKFHATPHMPSNVSAIEKLVEKSRSLMFSDMNTPILGDFCKKVMELAGEVKADSRFDTMRPWHMQYDMTVQYPNYNHGNWMHEYAIKVLPNYNYKALLEWIKTRVSLNDMLSPPLLCAAELPAIKAPVLVRGDIYPPGAAVQPRVKKQRSDEKWVQRDDTVARRRLRRVTGSDMVLQPIVPNVPPENKVELKDDKEEKEFKARSHGDRAKPLTTQERILYAIELKKAKGLKFTPYVAKESKESCAARRQVDGTWVVPGARAPRPSTPPRTTERNWRQKRPS